jgi:hypothetical protein
LKTLASAVERLVDTGRVVVVAVTECAAPTREDTELLEPLLADSAPMARQRGVLASTDAST